ncbi:MAG TPA: hypothetical protein VMF58_17890 [Rhizomicrobium sp.]|nr:hypothetical protein [Rhizomicrobium sp.]
MSAYWLTFLDWFASVSALIAIALTLTQLFGNRTYHATVHYLSQCDVALANPQFSNPELGEIDFNGHTFDGDAKQFERYEWYVARLIYTLDAAMRQAPFQQWGQVAKTQLAYHKRYFASEYYAKQNYLKHYSGRMRKLIQQQRAA